MLAVAVPSNHAFLFFLPFHSTDAQTLFCYPGLHTTWYLIIPPALAAMQLSTYLMTSIRYHATYPCAPSVSSIASYLLEHEALRLRHISLLPFASTNLRKQAHYILICEPRFNIRFNAQNLNVASQHALTFRHTQTANARINPPRASSILSDQRN